MCFFQIAISEIIYCDKYDNAVARIVSRQHLRSTSCSCHDTDVRCSVIEPSLLLVRWLGTHYQTVYETRHVLRTAFGGISNLFYSHLTQRRQRIRGLAIIALYESTVDADIDIYEVIHDK